MLEGLTLLEELIGVMRPPLQSNGNDVLTSLAVRVPDSSLEPLLPEGAWVLVVSSEDMPVRGEAVLVELLTGEKLLGYFVTSDVEDGILLMRTNPQSLEPRLWRSPQNSRILGVVLTVER